MRLISRSVQSHHWLQTSFQRVFPLRLKLLSLFCLSLFSVTCGQMAMPGRAVAQDAPPSVIASIKPVHSLVSAVMGNVGEVRLLVAGSASLHNHALKPSDVRAVAGADLLFWVGPGLESFLAKPLSANPPGQAVALIEADGLTLLEAREGGVWDSHDHDHAGHNHGHSNSHDHKHDHDDDHHHGEAGDHGDADDHDDVNSHVWLDPQNARIWVAAIADALAKVDPSRAAIYQANASETDRKLEALDVELKARLAPVASQPFVVFHDAYPYLEKRYGLNAAGSVTVDPDRRPSAKRVAALRARISSLAGFCVFAEPQFEPALVDTLIEGSKARKGVLDPEGAGFEPGPDLYPAMMRAMAVSLTECLGNGG